MTSDSDAIDDYLEWCERWRKKNREIVDDLKRLMGGLAQRFGLEEEDDGNDVDDDVVCRPLDDEERYSRYIR